MAAPMPMDAALDRPIVDGLEVDVDELVGRLVGVLVAGMVVVMKVEVGREATVLGSDP